MKETSLSSLLVLAVDCQAAYHLPPGDRLLEIGWKKCRASLPVKPEEAAGEAEVFLVKKPSNIHIQERVLSMTGIKREELDGGAEKKFIWNRLSRTARRSAVENRGLSPAVIHYKRYEEPLLRRLHRECTPRQTWPFTSIICTHEIFKKLYPGHPRKSLRAVAGFLGFSLPQDRRCLHHVAATSFIWTHLVHLLEKREGIVRLEELLTWLNNSEKPAFFPKCRRDYPMGKKVIQDLPDRPGIYKMYRSTGDLLYIGKAKSLKKRINSYFYQNSRHAEHILEMLSQAQLLAISETQTAFEAAVRESDEIKRLSPPYNRALCLKDRTLMFYSKDLRRKRVEPDSLHPVGPVLSSFRLEAFPELIDILNASSSSFNPRFLETMLSVPEGYGPDMECFLSGLLAFGEEYVCYTKPPVGLCHLMVWGTRFWNEKLEEGEAAKDEGQAEGLSEEKEEAEKERGWTPERVLKSIKRTIRLGAYQLRRARWFCRLSESALTWTKPDDEDGGKSMIVIDGGKVLFRGYDKSLDKGSLPLHHARNLRERQIMFDLEQYDRMRIITTELRRLIQEGRDVGLCFHPGKILRNEHLKKMLQWV